MKKTSIVKIALAMLAGNAMADSYRVSYTLRGSGRRVFVRAESTAEARRVVMAIIPGAVVTGAHRIKK
jgi:hypothetical protein